MKLTLKNYELVPAINFLKQMELKASESRHRTKLVNLLLEASKGLQESEMELIKEYGAKDESGELTQTDNGDYQLNESRVGEFHTEQKKLLMEEVTIEPGMYAKNIEQVQGILNAYDGVISGEDAEIYDRLLDEFENRRAYE